MLSHLLYTSPISRAFFVLACSYATCIGYCSDCCGLLWSKFSMFEVSSCSFHFFWWRMGLLYRSQPSCGDEAGTLVGPPVPHMLLMTVAGHRELRRVRDALQLGPKPGLELQRRLQDVFQDRLQLRNAHDEHASGPAAVAELQHHQVVLLLLRDDWTLGLDAMYKSHIYIYKYTHICI